MARFFKSRSLAAKLVQSGGVRINGERVTKASRGVGPGDVLTFSQGRAVRIVRVVATGARRGPAREAQTLYSDLSEPVSRSERPSRNDRRKVIEHKRGPLE